MSGITIQLENGRKILAQESTSTRIGYRMMGRETADRLKNKDLTDPSNKLGYMQSKFSVSADPESRAPYRTIGAAIEAARQTGERETVRILEGTYTENVTLRSLVDLESTQGATIRGSLISDVDGGDLTIRGLKIDTVDESLIHRGSATIDFIDCLLASDVGLVVDNEDAGVNFTECRIIGAAVFNVRSLSCHRCIIGVNVTPAYLMTITGGIVNFLYSYVNAQLQLSCENTTISHCTFTGAHDTRAVLNGGTLTLTHNTISSAPGENYFVAGEGTLVEAHNTYSGAGALAGPDVTLAGNYLLSGDYTPSFASDIPDQFATGTAFYHRVGNIVTVKFQALLTCGPTRNISIYISLPFQSKAFSSPTDAIGTVRISQPDPAGDLLANIFAEGTAVHFTGVADAASFMCGLNGEFTYKYM